MSQLFKQLFRHRPCQKDCWKSTIRLSAGRSQHGKRAHYSTRACKNELQMPVQPIGRPQRRSMSSRRQAKSSVESDWQQRTDIFPQDMSAEYRTYAMVTAQELRARRERPKRVRMLTRDFIEGSCRRVWLYEQWLTTSRQFI